MYSLGHQYSFNFCVVCKSWSTTTSHHSFPKDKSLQKKWLNILCLNAKDIKTNSRVCGDHFSKACFSLGTETRPHLLPGSLPNPLPKRNVIVSETSVVCKEECENGVDDVPSTSCDMPMQAENYYSPSESKIIVSETSISPKEECVNDLDDKSNIIVSETFILPKEECVNALDHNASKSKNNSKAVNINDYDTRASIPCKEECVDELDEKYNITVNGISILCKEERVNEMKNNDILPTSDEVPMLSEYLCSSSESTTGSDIAIKDEPFDETTAIQCPSCQPVKVKPSKRKYYVGDIKAVEDFSTPTMAKRNYDIIKRTMEKQRIKIRSLEQANRRLQKKINSLEGMIDDIKTENFIS